MTWVITLYLFFQVKSKASSFKYLLPNSKPVTVRTIYHPPNQSNFLEVLNKDTNKTESISNGIDILGWFNINLSLNDSSIFSKKKPKQTKQQKTKIKSIPSDVKSNYQLCNFFSWHQLIKVTTRITCNSATIIDQILASYPKRVTQQGIIDVWLSDPQLIFCTRKMSMIKRGTHKHIKFCSFKNYLADLFKETYYN